MNKLPESVGSLRVLEELLIAALAEADAAKQFDIAALIATALDMAKGRSVPEK